MAIDTKSNFSNRKFEQCSTDIMNLSGCTQIYGYLDIENNATLTICKDAGLGKVFTSDATGIGTWKDLPPTKTENITRVITQTSHGFVVKDVIGWSGTNYNKAIANGNYTGEIIGIVTEVINANSFKVTQSGYITGLSGLVTDTTYFLSDTTAGLISSTEPTTVGYLSKAVLLADSTTSGWVLPYVGYIISDTADGLLNWKGNTPNAIGTYVSISGICAQPNLTFDGNKLTTNSLSIKTPIVSTGADKILSISSTGEVSTGMTISTTYNSNSPATKAVGGVNVNDSLTGRSLENILEQILAPYIPPTFSAFNVNVTSPVEVGTVVNGTKTFTWGTTTSPNVATNSIGINYQNTSTNLATGLANDGSEVLNIGTLVNSGQQTWTWRITGNTTQNIPFNRDVSKVSIHPYFYGVSSCAVRPTPDSAFVAAGTKVVATSTSTVTVNFNGNNQWTWLAIPDTSTQKTCWWQSGLSNESMLVTGSRYPDVQCIKVTSPNGCWTNVCYKVYVSNFKSTDTLAVQFRNS